MGLVSGAEQALEAILSMVWHAPLTIVLFWVAWKLR